MIAEIIGKKSTEFQGTSGPVKMVKFYVAVDSGEVDEGRETNEFSWNEIENGKAPSLKIGQKVTVRYNRRGKLLYDENLSQETA